MYSELHALQLEEHLLALFYIIRHINDEALWRSSKLYSGAEKRSKST